MNQPGNVHEAAVQYYLDHCENYHAIVVDDDTLDCNSVLLPWHTAESSKVERADYWNDLLPFHMSEVMYKLLWKTSGGKRSRIAVIVVRNGECAMVYPLSKRSLTVDEKVRFAFATIRHHVHEDIHEGRLHDWYMQLVHGKQLIGTSHDVANADLAGEHRTSVEAAVKEGKLPAVVKIGKRVEIAILERPS